MTYPFSFSFFRIELSEEEKFFVKFGRMTSRGVVTWRRPIPPVVPQRASGSVVSISSNVMDVTRDSPVSLRSFFVQLPEEKWTDRLKTVSKKISGDINWLLSPNGDIVYANEELMDDSFVAGPSISTNELSSQHLWMMVTKKAAALDPSVRRMKRNGAIRVLQGSDEWIEMTLVPCQGPTRTGIALNVSPKYVLETDLLVDIFESICESSIEKFNQHINVQSNQVSRVRCSHYPNGIERFYAIKSVVPETAASLQIRIKNETMTVQEYFRRIRNISLQRPDLPLAVDTKGRFIPLELCHLTSPFQIPLVSPIPSVPTLSPENPILLELMKFGMGVTGNLKSTRGRQLAPLPVRGLTPLGRDIKVLVLSFLSQEESETLIGKFSSEFETRMKSKTELIGQYFLREEWENDLKVALNQLGTSPDMILIFSMSKVNAYNKIKCILDQRLRIPSQFLTMDRFELLKTSDVYWDTLFGHIASKVGPALPKLRPSGTVIGGIRAVGIPGVPCKLMSMTMTVDNGLSVFVNRAVAEIEKSDFDFQSLFYEILLDYFAACGMFPNRLIMYVSQPSTSVLFSCVSGLLRGVHAAVARLNRELRTGINPKLGSGPEINPNWTFVMCEQQNSVRIQTESSQSVVVNTGLVADHQVQFLVHTGICPKPVKYTVIHDTNNFTIPELENFTQQIRHVDWSIPYPLVHADRVLKRYLVYIEAEDRLLVNAGSEEIKMRLNQAFFDTELTHFRGRAIYI